MAAERAPGLSRASHGGLNRLPGRAILLMLRISLNLNEPTMILCICKAVSEREIDAAVRSGASTLAAIGERCSGAGTDCGMCHEAIEERLSLCSGLRPPPVAGKARSSHGSCASCPRVRDCH